METEENEIILYFNEFSEVTTKVSTEQTTG